MKKGELFYISGENDFYALVVFNRWVSNTVMEVVSCTYGWTFKVDFESMVISNMLTGTEYTFSGNEFWALRALGKEQPQEQL